MLCFFPPKLIGIKIDFFTQNTAVYAKSGSYVTSLFKKNAIIFAENWQKLVIMTLTPGCFFLIGYRMEVQSIFKYLPKFPFPKQDKIPRPSNFQLKTLKTTTIGLPHNCCFCKLCKYIFGRIEAYKNCTYTNPKS
jgi:hypothetical protein